MSATASPPKGFNTSSRHDPFLAPSSSAEELSQINSRHSPSDPYSSNAETPDTGLQSESESGNAGPYPYPTLAIDRSRSPQLGALSMIGTQNLSRAPFSASKNASETNHSAQSYGVWNTSSAGPSDFELAGFGEYMPQEFDDNSFLLEADFGLLPIPDDRNEGNANEEPVSATSMKSHPLSLGSRRSTGMATNSSQLMSPVLTDVMSPMSGNEASSPPLKTRLLGGGSMSRPGNYAQQTPAMTGSSVEASPEPTSRPSLAHSSSPVVRVESYSRGDSPTRAVNSSNPPGHKRGRSGSYLAAPDDEASDDDDDNREYNNRVSPVYAGSSDNARSPKHGAHARAGIDPRSRQQIAQATVPNFKDQEDAAHLESSNSEVTKWLSINEFDLSTYDENQNRSGTHRHRRDPIRRRAKSTSDQALFGINPLGISSGLATDNLQIPGPGVLAQEESEDEDDEEDDNEDEDDDRSSIESAPASVDGRITSIEQAEGISITIGDESCPPEAHPWIDPLRFPSQESEIAQPGTSNAAMMRFKRRAAEVDGASRIATWGTVRRMSESDLERVFGSAGFLSRLSISKPKDSTDRRGSFLQHVQQAADKFLPKKSQNSAGRKASEPMRYFASPSQPAEQDRKDSLASVYEKRTSLHERKESLGSRPGSSSFSSSLRRIPSAAKREKTPKITTSAVAAAAAQVAALGASGTGVVSPVAVQSPTRSWSALKRTAHHSFHRASSHEAAEPGLAALWNNAGGPPVPSLTSPPYEMKDPIPTMPVASRASFVPRSSGAIDDDDDADSDDNLDDMGFPMDFSPPAALPIPTFDGFKHNVAEVNPKLLTYLVDRLGQEQLRRYKKLVEFKVKHAQAIQQGICKSGAHCAEKGGVPTYFPSKSARKEVSLSHTGFSTTGFGDDDEDEDAMAEGTVSAAQFPPGVPMPPVKRLPAQFECPLCFQVKKFQKPSDWSKHVHEDLQPFTCTFPSCPDPKSFKRKADWVRHENERHRKLEWWACTENGCQHNCYRRDNFVQHLVREHRMPEPKAKTVKPNRPAVRGPAKSKGKAFKGPLQDVAPEDKVLLMVEMCRHETTKLAVDEPCRFCGTICSSWKKLTVHLAKHMEQISVPILELVKQKDVTPDTIISPIEQRLPSYHSSISPASQQNQFSRGSMSVSPFETPLMRGHIKQELPGNFTHIANHPAFQPLRYDDQGPGGYAWANSTQAAEMQVQNSSATFPDTMDASYLPNHSGYHDVPGAQFDSVNTGAGYMQTIPVSGAGNLYGVMGSHLPQTNYSGMPDYSSTIGQEPQFSTPQYVAHGAMNIHQQHPMNGPIQGQYDDDAGVSFSDSSHDPSLYPTPQQQQQQQFYGYQM